MSILRNLPLESPQSLSGMIEVREHQVISMSLSKSDKINMTLFAFAKGEDVSEEAYFGDTMYMCVEGELIISDSERKTVLKPGEVIMVPSGRLHAVSGKDAFKMLQITVNE